MTARLRRIASGITGVYAAQGWEELEALIRTKPVTVVIIDPAADGTLGIEEASELIGKYPMLYFILYASVNATSMNTVLELSKRGVKEVLAQGTHDSPRLLRAKLEQLECMALARTDFRALLPPLTNLPAEVARALEKMFQSPQHYPGAIDLAREAGVPLSRLYRSFELAHLRSPKDFLVAARVWHGYSYLREPGHSVRDVASTLGYSQPRVFVSHVRMVFGLPPSVLRTKLSVTEARECLSRWLTEKP